MAEIKERNGKWLSRVVWTDENGIRRSKSKSFDKKRDAQAFANEIENLKIKGFISVDSSSPFCDYFWNWFETYKGSSVSERTKLTYQQAFNALENYFGKVSIENVDRRKYQLFLRNYGKNHAKSTVSKYNSLIHACIKDAIYDGVIQKDFVQNTSLVYNQKKTRQIEYLSIDEIQRLSGYIESSLNVHFTAKYMILLAVYTGARLGEIQALTWQDINFNFTTIRINKSWNELTRKFQKTKNESSNRTVRVHPHVLELLKQLKTNETEQIFTNQYNTIPTSSGVNKTLRECLSSSNIDKKGFHFHSLRHTHVAFLLSQSIDLYIISKRLGHSDISTTSRVYSYLIDEYRTRSDNQIEKTLGIFVPKSSEKKTQIL
ncbi:tyrosine-type recombinase/integrase [Liquorilactobacillus hordei]|uniref:tyrosine-type recombinase/integrase n=1 Tax=Liquorilactobacillus hordei TaxID=468911 RepID=UPI001CBB0325|nr:site-specific integrase [Liquorilactobacillus hordei]MBZ2405153.1 site-specific integrase [Liquorilactobacillus hordei]